MFSKTLVCVVVVGLLAAGCSEEQSTSIPLPPLRKTSAGNDVPPVMEPETQKPMRQAAGSGFCQFSWEEKPGTTDYTTYDAFEKKFAAKGDRTQNQTLIGSKVQAKRSLCEKARALQSCFERVVSKSKENSAVKFREWASMRGIDPVLALMAKTEQETKLGTLEDQCQKGICNGIGIGQIITAVDVTGKEIPPNDPRWAGVTFNILTNLTYSVRVIALKIPNANNLRSLAYYYNGSSGADAYADRVVGYYNQLKQCGLR